MAEQVVQVGQHHDVQEAQQRRQHAVEHVGRGEKEEHVREKYDGHDGEDRERSDHEGDEHQEQHDAVARFAEKQYYEYTSIFSRFC